MSAERRVTVRPDRITVVGMLVCAAGAAIASADALASLASAAGWSRWVSWLLPIGVDCLAAVALRVWLDSSAPAKARRFGRLVAIGAVVASMAGNAASHLIATGGLAVTWPLVVVVGATPALALGAVAHLHAHRTGPVPGRSRKRPAATSASASAAESAAESALLYATPSAAASADQSAGRPSRKSATGGRTSAAEYTDRAVDGWQAGTDVTAAWIRDVTGCTRSTAYKILPAVRERVSERSGVVLKIAD